MPDEVVISAQGLRKSYGDLEAVRGIDIEVSRGEVFAFLGPKYDAQLQKFYTASTNDDIFKKRLVRGLLGAEAFTDTTPLRRQIAGVITPEAMADLAAAHQSGRRLIVGTTEEEGKRFVLWDIGAIACRNGRKPCSKSRR